VSYSNDLKNLLSQSCLFMVFDNFLTSARTSYN
jgi:hypothetical protein